MFIVTLLISTCIVNLSFREINAEKPEYLFESGTEGYACFRIPAMVTTPKGTLLAFAEGRKGCCSDTGDIDLVMKRSEDDGRTWTEPQEITGSVKKDHWTWYATGPCHGIQLKKGPHKGRLLVPCDHIEAATMKYFSHVIFSDDHGASWELGGTTPEDQVNECTVAELADGRLMLNMRNYDRSQECRKVSYSQDGGESWSHPVSDTTLIEPICQASLLSVTAVDGGKQFLLFLNPADTHERQRMTLRISENGGADWTGSVLLQEGPSAYSDLAQLQAGDIACLYEAGMDNPDQGLVYREVFWSQIVVDTK
ncbi:MAG: sialidase family protein [Bacteroidota bacterium]